MLTGSFIEDSYTLQLWPLDIKKKKKIYTFALLFE